MIFEKIKAVIIDQLDVAPEQVTLEANIQEDLGADSLELFQLIMALEEEFSIEISNEDAEGIVTVGDAVKYVERKQAE